MTLIITALYRGGLWQVSDRLTTLAKSGTPWDDEANKSIIVNLGHSMIFMGYSGVAHIQGFPTDTWLAAAAGGLGA